MTRWRVAYLVTHPIQYQAPLLRLIAAQPEIALTTFFCTDFSLRTYSDPGFGRSIAWDMPLTEGYAHEFLPVWGAKDSLTFTRPLIHGLGKRLKEGTFDALWVHGWGQLSHILAVLTANRLGIRVLMRGEAGLHLPQHGAVKQRLKDVLLRRLFARVDGFLTIGKLNREFFLHHGVASERIFTMPYAVNNAFFQEQARRVAAGRDALRAQLNLKPGRPVVLYASKMIERKRAEDLLEAFIRLSPDGQAEPPAYLLFVGDGDRRSALERRAAQFGWDAVRFLGFKNQTELPAYYDLCDVFVLPSRAEPWGLVVNEVMNAGRAVIVSDEVGCHPDLVRDGVNGSVFKAGDVVSLHAALARTLADPVGCEQMGKRSLDLINTWSFQEDLAGLKQGLASVMGAA